MTNFNYLRITKTRKIRYIKHIKKNAPYIVFLHGFMSDLEGKKPKAFLNFAKKNDLGFLALEYSGHGKSTGKFIYDKSYEFEKKVNSESVIWQHVETDYWISFLKKLILEHSEETGSLISKDIIKNFEDEIKNFVQVCPKEMINKLENPITFKTKTKEVS